MLASQILLSWSPDLLRDWVVRPLGEINASLSPRCIFILVFCKAQPFFSRTFVSCLSSCHFCKILSANASAAAFHSELLPCEICSEMLPKYPLLGLASSSRGFCASLSPAVI